MKIILYLIFFLIIANCSNIKGTYWCGDHHCINKNEKEAYFKKTMIVEIRKLNKENSKNNSEIDKIIQQAKLEEKRRIKEEKVLTKQTLSEEKRRIMEEKALAKQAKLEEKSRIKEEKDLAKKVERDEKKIIIREKTGSKQSIDTKSKIETAVIDLSDFNKLVEKITKKNTFRPYPNINDIPN